ncbi:MULTISPECIES: hypothetical protein [unclassified Rhizobacter]|uniref:hypothetical protein n=1 Tax=unclassified Rhizobacter TaxID=2640088 RepID=UPI000AA76A9B|nr:MULTISPECIES: hypothetical protein [unclassified Rhizobacter]
MLHCRRPAAARVSCALTKDFGAIVSYEGEEPEPLDEMLEATQEIIRDAADEA